MIFYFAPGGRLGNQIFQLAFLLSVARPKELCILSRMSDVLKLFMCDLSVAQIPEGFVYRLLDRVIVPFLVKPLVNLRIVSSLQEKNSKLRERKGLLSRIRVVSGYFQSEAFLKIEDKARLSLVTRIKERATAFLRSLPNSRIVIFVHIRRTDYLNYSVFGNRNTSLPLSYYEKAIKWFSTNIESPFFIFVGDDSSFARANFAWVAEKSISENDPLTDFAIMTSCAGGILSNSTLAWWAGRFVKNPIKLFAPKYWLGWKACKWYPANIQPSFAECISVD